MTLLALIKIDPAICHGEPRVKNYAVQSLLAHLQAGRTHEELLAHYEDLWEEDLLAVEGYASAIQYQGSLTIRELVEQVRRCFAETGVPYLTGTENCEWFLDHIYEKLDATGPQNHHLAMPRGKHHWQRFDRHSPLTPDLPVKGQFLTLSWLNHHDLLLLQEYLDRQELADEICGGGGICNDYVTCLAVIENGTHLPYRIHYTSRSGERKVLNKLEPEVIGNDDEWFVEFYNDVQIEWLDDSQQQSAP